MSALSYSPLNSGPTACGPLWPGRLRAHVGHRRAAVDFPKADKASRGLVGRGGCRPCGNAIAGLRREISDRCGICRRTNDSKRRSVEQRNCSLSLRYVRQPRWESRRSAGPARSAESPSAECCHCSVDQNLRLRARRSVAAPGSNRARISRGPRRAPRGTSWETTWVHPAARPDNQNERAVRVRRARRPRTPLFGP
jgi:hypothetical protein